MTEITYSAHLLCITRLCQAGGCENDALPGWPICDRHDRLHKRGIPITLHEIPPPLPDTLRCSECNKWKPDDAFPLIKESHRESRRNPGNQRSDRRGRYCNCLECEAKKRRASRAADPNYNAKQTARRAAAKRSK